MIFGRKSSPLLHKIFDEEALILGKRIRDLMFGQELSGESMPWHTVTELVDNKRLLVENHRGIIAYSCEKILIKLPFGRLCVSGCELNVACMTKTQLVINGTISSIIISKEGE